ncbi:hypothetical protein J4440_04170 [Candidatus Woesearchaeota archaeon]|nr:hypothetical protein [Candidatus Woesearchaeota archaeon]
MMKIINLFLILILAFILANCQNKGDVFNVDNQSLVENTSEENSNTKQFVEVDINNTIENKSLSVIKIENKSIQNQTPQLKVVAHASSAVDDPSSPLYGGGFNPKEGPGSQINIRTGTIGGIEVYYDNSFQGKTAPIDNDDQFGYLIDRLARTKRTVTTGFHNIVLVKNNVVLYNRTLYIHYKNESAKGEWIILNQ